MNHPLIIDRETGTKARLTGLLDDFYFGLYPQDGSTDEQVQQAGNDRAAVRVAIAVIEAADSDEEARRVFAAFFTGIAQATRKGVASGRLEGGVK